jgi:hypothetical protein
MSPPQLSGVEPMRATARFLDFLHHMLRAARPFAAFAVPEAHDVDLVRAEARALIEHPAVDALIGVVAVLQRASSLGAT